MSMAQFDEATLLQQAIAWHQAGRLPDAERAYRQILAANPQQHRAMHLLGVVAHQAGKLDAAAQLIQQSLAIQPNDAGSHYSLGNILRESGQMARAAEEFQAATRLQPGMIEAWSNLGTALAELGRLNDAEQSYIVALKLNPAIALSHYNLGNAYSDQGKHPQAIAAYREAIRLKPSFAEAHDALARAARMVGAFDESAAASRRAVEINPRSAAFCNTLASTLRDQGFLDDALRQYDLAIALDQDNPLYHSNRLYALHFHPQADAYALFREHRIWNRRHAERFKEQAGAEGRPMGSGRTGADARIRIGLVSPNFRTHPVGRFLRPLLSQYDRSRLEIICYDDTQFPDGLTESLRHDADAWRNVRKLSDEALARQIREDRVDILFDLTMHMAGNRLMTFARRPAPVQASWLAYCSTTGLDTINYRLSDPYLDPPGAGQAFYSEQTICLPAYWCYEPGMPTPDIGPLPAPAARRMTFGCLNHFGKISPNVISLWGAVLRSVPNSRLIMHCHEGIHRQRLLEQFRQAGVDAGRIALVPIVSGADYFKMYQQIDIALDPFPCAGGTTTCDALWMGVPVITLAGKTAVGRAGVSILNHIARPEWIAASAEQYVGLAVRLASDFSALSAIRSDLRPRMQRSILCDSPKFARGFEKACREMVASMPAAV